MPIEMIFQTLPDHSNQCRINLQTNLPNAKTSHDHSQVSFSRNQLPATKCPIVVAAAYSQFIFLFKCHQVVSTASGKAHLHYIRDLGPSIRVWAWTQSKQVNWCFVFTLIRVRVQDFFLWRPCHFVRACRYMNMNTLLLRVQYIRLEGPEDPHRRNSRFRPGVSAVTWPRSRFNTSGPDPLGFDWEGPAASQGTAGGHSGLPSLK